MNENEEYYVQYFSNEFNTWRTVSIPHLDYKDARRDCDRLANIMNCPVRIIRKTTRSSIVYESSMRVCYLTFGVVIVTNVHEKTTFIEDLASGFKLKLPYKEFQTPEELYSYGQSYLDMLKGMKQ